MRELVVQKDSSQALEQNDWKESKPLFGDGKIDAMKRRLQQKNPPSFYHLAVSPARNIIDAYCTGLAEPTKNTAEVAPGGLINTGDGFRSAGMC